MTALAVGAGRGHALAQPAPAYADWIPPSPKPPRRGGTLARASAWDPPVIDPRLTQSVGLFQFATLTSNRLVRYPFADEAAGVTDLTLKGDLAESWQSNADARVWTFKLRQGVKWQNVPPLNGRELVAADVKYCFEAYAKEGVQGFTFQEIEAIETPDRYTLRVHLKTPNTLFAHNVAEPVTIIFAREVLEEDGDLKKRLIGTGPYVLKEHTRKVRVVLARNPDYFDKGRPYVDEYVILSAPDSATRLAAFRTGQSDILWVAGVSEAEAIRKTNPSSVIQEIKNTLAPFGLGLAQDRAPFNDLRVRRAISMAIDRQKQVDTVFEGHGMLGWGVPYIYYQDKPPTAAQLGSWWQFRPAEAKRLLAEAGYPNGFDAGELTPASPYTSLGEAVANYLAAVGIKTKLRTMERAAFQTARNAKQLRGLCVCASARYGNAATRIEEVVVSTGVYARGGYPDIDALFKQQDSETDRAKREALLHQIQQLMHERVMFAPIWLYIWPSGIGPRVEDPALMSINPYPWSAPLEDVRLKQG